MNTLTTAVKVSALIATLVSGSEVHSFEKVEDINGNNHSIYFSHHELPYNIHASKEDIYISAEIWWSYTALNVDDGYVIEENEGPSDMVTFKELKAAATIAGLTLINTDHGLIAETTGPCLKETLSYEEELELSLS